MSKKNKHVYSHEIISIAIHDGELYLENCNNVVLVFNAISLFKDLPSIVGLCEKAYNLDAKEIKESLKNTVENFTSINE